jgi:predicted DNA-binding antitoxin AbrB/MazE fold protein
MTTVEAIYENGIFIPASGVPKSLKEHEQIKIIIENEIDEDLESEIAQWEAAGDGDFLKFEKSIR